jgi:hypothetical protein
LWRGGGIWFAFSSWWLVNFSLSIPFACSDTFRGIFDFTTSHIGFSILTNLDNTTEIVIWSELFTSGPNALILFTGLLGHLLEAVWCLFFPLGISWWVAEVGSEEISSSDCILILFNILSFSPLALINTRGSLLSISTLLNDSKISSHVFRSTEFSCWDHLSTVGENAWSNAIGSCFHENALVPHVRVVIVVLFSWVAEFLCEESW